jgi:hypothetical protein
MFKTYTLIVVAVIAIVLAGCNKKMHPTKTPAEIAAAKDDSLIAKYKVIVKKPKASVPKVIVVNDKAASRSVDGRLYYDLQGHRYWRNKNDGKYYLFNKSMFSDPAFQP